MRDQPMNKMACSERDKTAVVDDFTRIPGVPSFAAESLYNQGILTFAQLRAADVSWLHAPIRAAIKRWRDG